MRWLVPMLLVVAVMLASCTQTAPPPPGPVAPPPAPPTAPVQQAATIGDAAAGKVVYENSCFKCHDADGTGKTRSGRMFNTPDLRPLIPRRSDEDLVKVIRDGVGKMDGFKAKLSADDIQNVVAYLRELADTD